MLEKNNFHSGHPTNFFAHWSTLISTVGNRDDPLHEENSKKWGIQVVIFMIFRTALVFHNMGTYNVVEGDQLLEQK